MWTKQLLSTFHFVWHECSVKSILHTNKSHPKFPFHSQRVIENNRKGLREKTLMPSYHQIENFYEYKLRKKYKREKERTLSWNNLIFWWRYHFLCLIFYCWDKWTIAKKGANIQNIEIDFNCVSFNLEFCATAKIFYFFIRWIIFVFLSLIFNSLDWLTRLYLRRSFFLLLMKNGDIVNCHKYSVDVFPLRQIIPSKISQTFHCLLSLT